MWDFKIISGTLKGKSKRLNEDGFFILNEPEYILLGVLDGVGSAKGAKAAVNLAINYVVDKVHTYYSKGKFNLARLVNDLNETIINSKVHQPFSTCVIVWLPKLHNKNVKFVSLGDSRVYAVGRQYLSQLSTDHNHPFDTNVLTQYLGKKDLLKESYSEYQYAGDANNLLICTDGVYKQIDNLGDFHRVLNLKYMKCIKNGINKRLIGVNNDDATYIFVRWINVRN